MTNVLSLIAGHLKIRSVVRIPGGGYYFKYRDAPDDVKELLANVLAQCEGWCTYDYWGRKGTVRNQRPFGIKENGQLKYAFKTLPKLPYGDEYAFSCETFFWVPCPKKGTKAFNEMSPWVKALYEEAEIN